MCECFFQPFMASGLVHSYHLDESFSGFRGVLVAVFVFIVGCIGIPVSKQCRPSHAASELGLHCLHMSPKWGSGLKRVNCYRMLGSYSFFHAYTFADTYTYRNCLNISF